MDLTLAIPSYDNPNQLMDAVMSLVVNTDFNGRLLVVNNGKRDYYDYIQGAVPYEVDWVNAGTNLGWIGGINEALKASDTEFFCMMNDDVLFPPNSKHFWHDTLKWFHLSGTGGVGPTSNYVMGLQSAFLPLKENCWYVPYLIGFCATYRTDLLKGLGGLDPQLPGGDDLDLSIRVKDSGYALITDRRHYLHHHGSQTGRRLFAGFWDSQDHQADTYNALIKKHGLRRWYEMMHDQPSAIAFLGEEPRTAVANLARYVRQKEAGSLEDRYYRSLLAPTDIDTHLMTLYRFASGCSHVTEMGADDGTSSTAFLYAKPKRFVSFDIKRKPEIDDLERQAKAEGIDYQFHEMDTGSDEAAAAFEDTDFLFLDDLHVGEHLAGELEMYAPRVRKYIFLHDTTLYGVAGEHKMSGIWPPVAAFLRANPEWRLIYTTEHQNGLTGLMRIR